MSKWPQHRNPRADRAAKAPYNFVLLPEKVVTVDARRLPDQDSYHAGRLTGQLECELTTASPLYVRTALDPDKAEDTRKNPDFFYTADPAAPVIPGSSLRGMMRALVEIASHSKMQWVSRNALVYRAIGDMSSHGEAYRLRLMRGDGEDYEEGKRVHLYTPLMEAGYVRRKPDGDWYIQPAQRIDGTTFARIPATRIPKDLKPWHDLRSASEVYIQTGRYEYQKVRGGFIRIKRAPVLRAAANPEPGLRKAALVPSGWMVSKRSEAVVYEPDESAKPIQIGDDLVRAYRDQLTHVYADQSLRGRGKDEVSSPTGVLAPEHPVFYLLDEGKLVFFSHCQMLRLPYKLNPQDFVPPALRRETDTDLAEAIFGYTKGKDEDRPWPKGAALPKEDAYAGRVSVTDAALSADQPGPIWLNEGRPIVPKILGSPKPTTFQHYLVQQHPEPVPTGGRFPDGSPRTRVELSDYASKTPDETTLRGHKLYWHKGQASQELISEAQLDKKSETQLTRIRPVAKGVRFSFSIHFENLTEIELGALLWVLERGKDERFRLKLGMGKPLGMGAVAISSSLHLDDRSKRYSHLFADGNWATDEASSEQTWASAVEQFERFVLDGLNERGPKSLADLPRIRQLLALLSWPGPDPAETRYLEIEHEDSTAKRGKVNEYKERPVLPDPLAVLGGHPGTSSGAQSVRQQVGESRPAGRQLAPGYRRGTVKSFGLGPSQSFGFITLPGEPDVFVHRSKLAPGVTTLKAGQQVTFRLVKGMKGSEADDVLVVE